MKKKNFYVITKTPLRVSFVGGGTDLPFFYKKKYGLVVSTTINKFVYVSVKSHDRLFKENYRLNYSSTEHIKGGMDKIKNKIVRACLKYMNIHVPLNINISSDLPASTGLGSSSAIIVGLLKALHALTNKNISTSELAEKACKVEINILKNPIGKQDQYSASFGGFRSYKFKKDESVQIEKKNNKIVQKILKNSLFLWLDNFKDSKKILFDQKKNFFKKRNHYLKLLNIAKNVNENFKKKKFKLNDFALKLNENWKIKRELSKFITNKKIDNLYKVSISKGALAGKVLGAGNGGFLMILTNSKKLKKLKKYFKKKAIYDFSFYKFGSKIIYKKTY